MSGLHLSFFFGTEILTVLMNVVKPQYDTQDEEANLQFLLVLVLSSDFDIRLSQFFCLHQYSFQSLKNLDKEDPGQARARLRGVRGYLVKLPLHFLEKEDLRPPVGSSEFFVSEGVFT